MAGYVKNQPTVVDGHNFPSKLEAAVYQNLKMMERAGEITDIRRQVSIPLVGKLRFKVDFVVHNIKLDINQAHEAKGFVNDRFRTIVQVWPGAGPMDLYIWKGSHLRPFIEKIIKGIK